MTRRAKIVLAFFAVTQVLDGVLTYAGLMRGVPEGNPLYVWMMSGMGTIAALCTLKLASLVFAAFIARYRVRVLELATAIIWVFAILPWVYVLCVI